MSWVKILEPSAGAALTENRPMLFRVEGKRLCVVKRSGQILAVQDTCTHSGESLSKGIVNYLGEIVCPMHHHQFNLKTGRECSQRSRDLEVFPVKTDDDGIFVLI